MNESLIHYYLRNSELDFLKETIMKLIWNPRNKLKNIYDAKWGDKYIMKFCIICMSSTGISDVTITYYNNNDQDGLLIENKSFNSLTTAQIFCQNWVNNFIESLSIFEEKKFSKSQKNPWEQTTEEYIKEAIQNKTGYLENLYKKWEEIEEAKIAEDMRKKELQQIMADGQQVAMDDEK